MNQQKKQIVIAMLAFAYIAFYNILYMKGLYYDTALLGFSLTNLQLGQLYSACGIFAMGAYLCGAIFLNHFSSCSLIICSSFIMCGFTFLLCMLPPYPVLLLVFALSGFVLNATFFPSYVDILNRIADTTEEQGHIFSRFYIYNSIIGCITAAIGFWLIDFGATPQENLHLLLLFFGILNFITAVWAFQTLRNIPGMADKKPLLNFKDLKAVLSSKKLWLVIFIIFANYINFCNLNYTLPYLTSTMSLPKQLVDFVSIARVYVLVIAAAPVACILTNRLHSSVKMMRICFISYSIVTLMMILCFRGNNFLTISCILLMCFFTNMGKCMSLITIQEAGLPPMLSGIAISILAFAGYSPDAFYYSVTGFLLDTLPKSGYLITFIASAIISLLGALTCRQLRKNHS